MAYHGLHLPLLLLFLPLLVEEVLQEERLLLQEQWPATVLAELSRLEWALLGGTLGKQGLLLGLGTQEGLRAQTLDVEGMGLREPRELLLSLWWNTKVLWGRLATAHHSHVQVTHWSSGGHKTSNLLVTSREDIRVSTGRTNQGRVDPVGPMVLVYMAC